MSAAPNFIHLRVHSAYSLAEGAIKTGKLIDAAVKMNMPAIAVTDTNNMFGAMDFCFNAVKKGIQPIVGIQVDFLVPSVDAKQKKATAPIVLLVQTEQGYKNLCKINSRMYTHKGPMDDPWVTLDLLREFADGLICLTGGANGPLAALLRDQKSAEAISLLTEFKKMFGDRLYVELTRHGNWLRRIDHDLINMAHVHNVPLVATNNVFFLDKKFYEAHDALLCIAAGRYITETDRRRETPDHYLKSPEEMVALFSDVPEAIANTVTIARRCHFYLKPVKPQFPNYPIPDGRTEADEITLQARTGLKMRLEKYIFPTARDAAHKAELEKQYSDRLELEIGVIVKMGFSGYFLVVSDFIRWAKDQDIPVGPGRGSGAGSLVAWALQITDIDPIPYGLLFERFLNPERVSMPDFDIDFCQDRRDEVIAYVQNKYGHDHVGQIITFGELKARAAVRDVGRVLQMPYGQVDRISKMIPHNPAKPITLTEAIETDPELKRLKETDETVGRLLDIALQVEGLYRHASTHAAGIVIGNKPLDDIVPLYQDPRSTIPATQYNLKYIEDAGLLKFDFLGLKTLTVLQKATQFIKQTRGQDIDLLMLPWGDDKTYKLVASGQTLGIFQFEGSGMQDTMRKVKPDRFEDLIAIASLYRPGPMENIPQYAKVKNGEAVAEYPHEKLHNILAETHGIMVYQEQVMEIGKVLAGYTLGGADLLRRAMGKKIKAEMDAQRERFVDGAVKTSNVSPEKANEIFDLMAKFADYGFNKSHAAAYSLIAYQTAYLKANYTVEFMAALMTLDQHDTDKISIYVQDLQRLNIALLPPDINASMPYFAVEKTENGAAIRYALAALKGVGYQAMQDMVNERTTNGPFTDMLDFIRRADAKSFSRKQLEVLVDAGAFDRFGHSRAALSEASDYLMRRIQRRAEEANSGQVSLFAAAPNMATEEPLKIPNMAEYPSMEKLQNEFKAVGFYLSAHPVDNYADWLDRKGYVGWRDIVTSVPPMLGGRMAGVVVRKVEKKSERGRFAFITLSDRTGVFEATIYTEPLMQHRDLFVAGNLLALQVDVQWREEEPRLIIRSAALLDQIVSKSITSVHVTLTPSADAAQIGKFLGQCAQKNGAGGVKVTVDVPLRDGPGVTTLAPPAAMKLMESDIQTLRAMSGVEVVVQ